MRYLIIADMHGNADALATVLEDAERVGYDEVLLLGDLVGYGASPNEVVARLRDLNVPTHSVRGNHDKVVTGIDEGLNFNPTALLAARWAADELTEQNLDFVRDLPQGPVQVARDLVICHGSLVDEDEYLLSAVDALESFRLLHDQVTFFGHTHIPSVFTYRGDEVEVAVLEGNDLSLQIDPGTRYLLNPGSVGQPRDRDARASYMQYDRGSGLVRLRRLEYPIEQAQEKIRRAGLPDILADRLAVGI